ncbi:MAG: hypothetical protein ACFFCS_06740, partial [Candidatus Hodarchaeota archaeon]
KYDMMVVDTFDDGNDHYALICPIWNSVDPQYRLVVRFTDGDTTMLREGPGNGLPGALPNQPAFPAGSTGQDLWNSIQGARQQIADPFDNTFADLDDYFQSVGINWQNRLSDPRTPLPYFAL